MSQQDTYANKPAYGKEDIHHIEEIPSSEKDTGSAAHDQPYVYPTQPDTSNFMGRMKYAHYSYACIHGL